MIIPTFDAPHERLQRALESALACPKLNQLIVVDDGSDIPVRLPGGATRSGKARLIRQDNAGPSRARNTGLRSSRAETVVFLDDDDVLIPEGVSSMRELARETAAAAVVAARFEQPASGGEAVRRDVPEEWADRVLARPGDVFRPIALFSGSGIMIRRASREAGVAFDEGLRIGEDRDFLYRVAQAGPIAVSSKPAVVRTLHSGGSNLTGPAHFQRRVEDHLVLLSRYHDTTTDGYFRDATKWLVKHAAGRIDDDAWDALVFACKARAWPVPAKAKLARRVRRFRGSE